MQDGGGAGGEGGREGGCEDPGIDIHPMVPVPPEIPLPSILPLPHHVGENNETMTAILRVSRELQQFRPPPPAGKIVEG